MSFEMFEIPNEDCYTLKMEAADSSKKADNDLPFDVRSYARRLDASSTLRWEHLAAYRRQTILSFQDQELVGFDVYPAESCCRMLRPDVRGDSNAVTSSALQLCIRSGIFGRDRSTTFDTSGILNSPRQDGSWRHFQNTQPNCSLFPARLKPQLKQNS